MNNLSEKLKEVTKKMSLSTLTKEEQGLITRLRTLKARAEYCHAKIIEVLVKIKKCKLYMKLHYSTLVSFLKAEMGYNDYEATNLMTLTDICCNGKEGLKQIRSGELYYTKARALKPLLINGRTDEILKETKDMSLRTSSKWAVKERLKDKEAKFRPGLRGKAKAVSQISQFQREILYQRYTSPQIARIILKTMSKWVRNNPNRSAEDLLEYMQEYVGIA